VDANTIMVWNLTGALPWRRRVRLRCALLLHAVGLQRIAVRVAVTGQSDRVKHRLKLARVVHAFGTGARGQRHGAPVDGQAMVAARLTSVH
jgi:hypothetical protein